MGALDRSVFVSVLPNFQNKQKQIKIEIDVK